MNDTADRVRKLIAEHLCVDLEQVHDLAVLTVDLKADSLDIIEIQMALEDEFRIRVTDDEAEAVMNVGDAIKLVDSKLATVSG